MGTRRPRGLPRSRDPELTGLASAPTAGPRGPPHVLSCHSHSPRPAGSPQPPPPLPRALPGCSGSRSRPGPSSHSAGGPGTASHTWRRQSAGGVGREGSVRPGATSQRTAGKRRLVGGGPRWADTSTDCSWSADPTPSLMPGGAASAPGHGRPRPPCRRWRGARAVAGCTVCLWRPPLQAQSPRAHLPPVEAVACEDSPSPGGPGAAPGPRKQAAQGRDCGTQSWPGHGLARLPARWCP